VAGCGHLFHSVGLYCAVLRYHSRMAHTTKDKEKLLTRVRRIRGQVEAIERALESEEECTSVLQLMAACRGALNGLMAEAMEGHVRFHVLSPDNGKNSPQARAAEELIEVVRAYLK
jgi:DNA-binding FrmR family transcriptional regulator